MKPSQEKSSLSHDADDIAVEGVNGRDENDSDSSNFPNKDEYDHETPTKGFGNSEMDRTAETTELSHSSSDRHRMQLGSKNVDSKWASAAEVSAAKRNTVDEQTVFVKADQGDLESETVASLDASSGPPPTASLRRAAETEGTASTASTEASRVGAHSVEGRASGPVPRWAYDDSSDDEDEEVDEESLEVLGRRNDVSNNSAISSRRRFSLPSIRRGSGSMQLARANLVDDAEPIVEALNVESELRQRKRRNRVTLSLVLLVTAAMVIAAVVIATRPSGVEPKKPDKCHTVPEGDFLLQCECSGALQEGHGRPTSAEWDLRDQIVRALQLESVLADDFLTNSSTDLCEPRNEALWWLVQTWNNENATEEHAPQFDQDGRIVLRGNKRLFIDRFISALLFFSLNGRNWKKNDGWLDPASSYCSWQGISCQAPDFLGRIREYSLSGNDLNGTLPSELAKISFIEKLRLEKNPLMRGTFPAAIFDILPLIEVKATGSGLEGALHDLIPSAPNRSELFGLRLDGNKLTGTLPSEYGTFFPRLERFEVGKNRVGGTIPSEFGLLQDLEYLFLKNNQFEGTLPTELFNLPYLKQLDASNNMLTGPLPSSVGNANRLSVLDVSHNNFTGENRADQYCNESEPHLYLIYVDCDDFENTNADGFCGEGLDQAAQDCICVCTSDRESESSRPEDGG